MTKTVTRLSHKRERRQMILKEATEKPKAYVYTEEQLT